MNGADNRFLEMLAETSTENISLKKSTESFHLNMDLTFLVVLIDASILVCIWAYPTKEIVGLSICCSQRYYAPYEAWLLQHWYQFSTHNISFCKYTTREQSGRNTKN